MDTQPDRPAPGRYLLLGATGGIGSALTRRLSAQGHRVLAAAQRRAPPATGRGDRWCRGRRPSSTSATSTA